MGISKRSISRQRAAGWCKATGRHAEIPPGAAFLKDTVGKDGVARNSERRCWTP